MILLLLLSTFGGVSRAQDVYAFPETRSPFTDTLLVHNAFDTALAVSIRNEAATRTTNQRAINWAWKNAIAELLIRGRQMRAADSVLSATSLDTPGMSRVDSLLLAHTLTLQGTVLGFNDRYDLALACLHRGLDILAACAPDDLLSVLNIHHVRGAVYHRMGRLRDAFDALDHAEAIARSITDSDPSLLPSVLCTRGFVQASAGDHVTAIRSLEGALALLQPGPASEITTRCHYGLGIISRDRGELQRAEEQFRLALESAEQLFGHHNLLVSATLARLGEISALQGDGGAAVQYYEEALPITASILGTGHSAYAWQEFQFSLPLMASGDTKRALALGTKASEHFGRMFGTCHPLTAQVMEGVADLQAQGGTMEQAISFMRRAIAMCDSAREGDPSPLRARRLTKLGRMLLPTGATSDAEETYRRSYALQDTMTQRVPVVYGQTLKGLGDVEYRKGHFATALDRYQEALRAFNPGFRDSSWAANPPLPGIDLAEYYRDVLYAKATTLTAWAAHEGHPAKALSSALAAWRCAADAATMLRRDFREEESKLRLQRDVLPVFESGMALSARLYALTHRPEYFASAFAFAERGRAAILTDARLWERTWGTSPKAMAPTATSVDSLTALVRGLSTRMEHLAQERNEAERESTRKRMFQATEALRVAQESITKGNLVPARAPMSCSVAELRRSLRPDEGVVEYARVASNLLIMVIRRENITLVSVTLPEDFDEQVQRFLGNIKTCNRREFIAGSSALYDLLLRPVEARIHQCRHLILVPEGVLCMVPFEALLRENVASANYATLPYLLRSHAVSYAFSAGTFLASRSASAPVTSRWSFAGFAPVFRGAAGSRPPSLGACTATRNIAGTRAATMETQRYRELPFSEQEVRAIGEVFSRRGAPSAVFCNGDATIRNLKNTGSHAAFLHIATHGVVNTERPDLSALVLSPEDSGGESDDGLFYAGETYGLRLSARLVTLSSCEGGAGKLARGEGVMTLARGFYAAGAKNLLYSLWKVSDQRTSELMVRFYRGVCRGLSFADALRLAKLEALESPSTANPFAWGGFVLLGE